MFHPNMLTEFLVRDVVDLPLATDMDSDRRVRERHTCIRCLSKIAKTASTLSGSENYPLQPRWVDLCPECFNLLFEITSYHKYEDGIPSDMGLD